MDWLTAKEVLAPPHVAGMALEEFRGLLRTFVAEAVEVTPDIETQMLSDHARAGRRHDHPRLARSNHFRILRAIWEQDLYALWARVLQGADARDRGARCLRAAGAGVGTARGRRCAGYGRWHAVGR